METARTAALRVLNGVHRKGEWANEGLRKALRDMDPREAALATRLVYGVVQNQMLLDDCLGSLSSIPLEKLNGNVLDILRLGGYQILFMDQIPARAAVDEAVKMTKKCAKNPKTAGFVNGVLRNLDRRKDAWKAEWEQKRGGSGQDLGWLGVRYSHPQWLVEEFAGQLEGDMEQVEAVLAANNAPAAMTAQVNTCKISVETLAEELKGAGVSVQEHPWQKDCLLLEDTGNLEKLDAFQKGYFYIQDPAARTAVLAAAPKAGERVLDVCAAPGGKSFAAAVVMGNEGEIVSRDVYSWKVAEIEKGAARLGLSCIKAVAGDATKTMEHGGKFDLVIADVPCSGLGIIRKKPDIRYKDPASFEELARIQTAILEAAGAAVKAGGRLLYATCTLRREENEGRVAAFLGRHGEFSLQSQETLWPHKTGTDGFYYAVLTREVTG